jgi:hypothetical protein
VTYQFIEKQVYVNELKISYLEAGIATISEPILFLRGWGVGIEPYQEVINSFQTLLLALKKDLKRVLPKIQSPCLIVWVKNDLTSPLNAAQQFPQLIKHSQIIVADEVSHQWSIFLVNKFTNIVFDFINKIKAGENGEK